MATLYQLAPGYFVALKDAPVTSVFRIHGGHEGINRLVYYSLCPAVAEVNGTVAIVSGTGKVYPEVDNTIQVELVGLLA